MPLAPAWSRMTSTRGLPVERVVLAQHLGGDLDEVRLELTGVPLGEHVGDLCGCLAGAAADQVVGLRDQLHVGVLDAVVHHLHEVACAVVADVGHARLALCDRGDRLEDRPESHPRLVGAARHDRWAVERTLFAAGDACTDEVDARLTDRLLAADGVGEVGVAAVDDDVARFEDPDELVDDRIRAAAGLDHDDGRAGLRQRCGELLVRERGDEPGLGVLGHQRVGLLTTAVVHRDGVPFAAGKVAGQVRPHHGKSDDSDIRTHAYKVIAPESVRETRAVRSAVRSRTAFLVRMIRRVGWERPRRGIAMHGIRYRRGCAGHNALLTRRVRVEKLNHRGSHMPRVRGES